MEEDSENYIDELQSELRERDRGFGDVGGNFSAFQQQDQNLIVWQLELDNILERIEHLLRGDIVTQDEEGNIKYTSPDEKELIVLNDYGVKLIMNVISFYLNRNTILSRYTEERVMAILYDLGIELSDLIYTSYEKMGLDTPQKKARYPVLVMNILHTIESSYRRALGSGERDSLRSARMVTQTEPLGNRIPQQSSKKFSLFKPATWT